MKRRAATLVELMVAMAVAAVIATIAGALLIKGLDSWRKEADRSTAVRKATLAADHMAEDLAAQPSWSDIASPVDHFELASDGASIAFFLTGEDSREFAVIWYLSGETRTLYRYEATAEETAAALPGNVAAEKWAEATADTTGKIRIAYVSASIRYCDGVQLVKELTPPGGVNQIVLNLLTAEGRARLTDGEPLEEIPERCVIHLARPVPLSQ